MSDPVSDLKQELLAAAERRYGHAPVPRGHRSWRGHLGLRPLLLTSAALSITAVVALLFTAPWSSSPSFLATAEAALTPPTGTVMHMRWEWTKTSAGGLHGRSGPNEIWIDQAPPHRYRALQNRLPPGSSKYRSAHAPPVLHPGPVPPSSAAHTLEPRAPCDFVPPNRLN